MRAKCAEFEQLFEGNKEISDLVEERDLLRTKCVKFEQLAQENKCLSQLIIENDQLKAKLVYYESAFGDEVGLSKEEYAENYHVI